MATVHAFQVEGVRLWFWSDDHEPPHFHAKKSGEWEVKVHFLLSPDEMIEIKWSKKEPSRRLLNRICKLAEANRAALLREWESLRG